MTAATLETAEIKDSLARPVLASLSLFGMQFMTGSIEGHSAVLLPQLKETETFKLSLETESWIASLGIMLTPVGAILSGLILDRYGRKWTCYIFYILSTFSFACIAFAQSIEHIYIGRLLGAAAHGFTLCSIVYIFEVCTSKQSSKLLPLLCPICSCGVLYVYAVGGYLPWNWASLSMAVTSFVGFVSVLFIPESPAWLIKTNREDEAIKSFEWLRRSKTTMTKELEELKKSCSHEDLPQNFKIKQFLLPTVWKPFVILLIFSVLQNGAGIYMLTYYTVDFFRELGTQFDPLMLTVVLAISKTFSGSFGAFCIGRFSRKKLMATSTSGMSLCMAIGIGYLIYYNNIPAEGRPYRWIIIFCSFTYVLLSTLAIQPLPWLMSGELYPLALRGIMNGLTTCFLFSLVFAGLKAYPFIVYYAHTIGVLIIFGVFSFLCVPCSLILLPETLNKTPQEIQDYFMSTKEKGKMRLQKSSTLT